MFAIVGHWPNPRTATDTDTEATCRMKTLTRLSRSAFGLDGTP